MSKGNCRACKMDTNGKGRALFIHTCDEKNPTSKGPLIGWKFNGQAVYHGSPIKDVLEVYKYAKK